VTIYPTDCHESWTSTQVYCCIYWSSSQSIMHVGIPLELTHDGWLGLPMSQSDSTRHYLAQYMTSIESLSVESLAPQCTSTHLHLTQPHENIWCPPQVLGMCLLKYIMLKGCPKIHPLSLYMNIGHLDNPKIHILSSSMLVRRRCCAPSSLKALHIVLFLLLHPRPNNQLESS